MSRNFEIWKDFKGYLGQQSVLSGILTDFKGYLGQQSVLSGILTDFKGYLGQQSVLSGILTDFKGYLGQQSVLSRFTYSHDARNCMSRAVIRIARTLIKRGGHQALRNSCSHLS
ncbi:hypothetical protein AVEN_12035-1 [Araneus ventricosus]|uniref:Uncharacterized protein n=1 Tax=Araneus ventricosus TaxID=182803 RepID=A0A4Y2FUL1_ARAVE|nr:hypothetical protein AVEN_12035-1 [Araneus ventricosus]